MWRSPEARLKLQQIREQIRITLAHMDEARLRGPADTAQAIGIGIETLVGITETFEFDPEFRVRIRTMAERWRGFDADERALRRTHDSVVMALQRLDLLAGSA